MRSSTLDTPEEITSAMNGRTYRSSATIADPSNPYQPLADAINAAIIPLLDPGTTTITCGRGRRDGIATMVVTNDQGGAASWQLALRTGSAPFFHGDLTPAALKAISIATETKLGGDDARS